MRFDSPAVGRTRRPHAVRAALLVVLIGTVLAGIVVLVVVLGLTAAAAGWTSGGPIRF